MIVSAVDAVAGMRPREVFEPSSAEQLGEFVRSTAKENSALLAIGSGTTLELGNEPLRYDVAIHTRALRRVVEYIPEDQVVIAEAGITLGELQAALRQNAQRLAIDAPNSDQMTIGGMLAANVYGPLALRYGTLKDLIVGIEIVRADGAIARAGGKVVKNVAGFDVSKLMVGSLGTLAIITKATFRLHPIPQARRTLAFSCPAAQIFPFVLALREAQLEPSSITAHLNGADSRIEVTFEGFSAGVDAQCERCTSLVIPSVAEARGASEREVEGQRKCRLKATFPPTEFARVAAEVDAALVYPSLGVIFFDAEDLEQTKRLRAFFESLGGTLVVHEMPPEWRGKIDAWGTAGPSVRLMQALKERFDPQHRLAPGRFVGGI